MSKKELTRLYSMSDADLKQQADNVKALITRDITDFNTRGVTSITLSDFQDLIDDFDDLETDEEMVGEVMEATNNKNNLAEHVRKGIRSIRNMADIVYKGIGKYNSFGFTDMANMSDNELYRLAKRVVRVGTKVLAELASQGLTQQVLDDFATLSVAFDQSIDAQQKAVEDRDLATAERVSQGNTLYAEMSRLCSIGKTLYEDTNEARYND